MHSLKAEMTEVVNASIQLLHLFVQKKKKTTAFINANLTEICIY
jgi:hypothetical protein